MPDKINGYGGYCMANKESLRNPERVMRKKTLEGTAGRTIEPKPQHEALETMNPALLNRTIKEQPGRLVIALGDSAATEIARIALHKQITRSEVARRALALYSIVTKAYEKHPEAQLAILGETYTELLWSNQL